MFPCQIKSATDITRSNDPISMCMILDTRCMIIGRNYSVKIPECEIMTHDPIDTLKHYSNILIDGLCENCEWRKKYMEVYK